MQGGSRHNILQDGGRDFDADLSGGEILGDESDRGFDLCGNILSYTILMFFGLPRVPLLFLSLYPRSMYLAESLFPSQAQGEAPSQAADCTSSSAALHATPRRDQASNKLKQA